LQFNITLASGKPVTSDHVVNALVQVLRAHGLSIAKEDGYLVIHKGVMEEYATTHERHENAPLRTYDKVAEFPATQPSATQADEQMQVAASPLVYQSNPKFLVYKLQYHAGDEIEETIKKIAG